MKIVWNKEDVKLPRFSYEGIKHHMEYSYQHNVVNAPTPSTAGNLGSELGTAVQDPILKLFKEKYGSYGKFIKPEKPAK